MIKFLQDVVETFVFFLLSLFSTLVFGAFLVAPPAAAYALGWYQMLALYPFCIYSGTQLYKAMKEDSL